MKKTYESLIAANKKLLKEMPSICRIFGIDTALAEAGVKAADARKGRMIAINKTAKAPVTKTKVSKRR